MVSICPGCDQSLTDKHQQIRRKLIAVFIEQSLVGQVGVERHSFVAKAVIHGSLQERSKRAGIIDRQTDTAHSSQSLCRQIANDLLPARIDVRDIRQHTRRQYGGCDEVFTTHSTLCKWCDAIPVVVFVSNCSGRSLKQHQTLHLGVRINR